MMVERFHAAIAARPGLRFALRRTEAASAVGVSPSKFDQWVKAGRMPSGRRIDGVVLWDAMEVQAAWETMRDQATVARSDAAEQDGWDLA